MRLTLYAVASLLAVGCSFSIEGDVSSSRHAINSGATDTQPIRVHQARTNGTVRFTTVSRLPDGGTTASGLCSATLVSPRLVLTAAHCVDDDGHIPGNVRFEPTGINPVGIRQCFMHASYSDPVDPVHGSIGGPEGVSVDPCAAHVQDLPRRAKHDLAMLILDQRVEYQRAGASDVIPVPIDTRLVSAGTSVRIAGYGRDGATLPPSRQFRMVPTGGYHDALLYGHFTDGTLRFDDDVFGGGDSGGSVLLGTPDTGLSLVATICV